MSIINKIWKYLSFNDEEKTKFSFAIIMLIFSLSILLYENRKKEIRKEESLTYGKQIERLASIQDSVKELSDFVSQQQKNLEASRDTLQNLEYERKRLEPVVQADREFVEEILKLRAEKEIFNAWRERGIGFFLGIAGSLTASLIIAVCRKHMGANVQ